MSRSGKTGSTSGILSCSSLLSAGTSAVVSGSLLVDIVNCRQEAVDDRQQVVDQAFQAACHFLFTLYSTIGITISRPQALDFGKRTCSTPSSNLAVICSASTSHLTVTLKENAPYSRSKQRKRTGFGSSLG